MNVFFSNLSWAFSTASALTHGFAYDMCAGILFSTGATLLFCLLIGFLDSLMRNSFIFKMRLASSMLATSGHGLFDVSLKYSVHFC